MKPICLKYVMHTFSEKKWSSNSRYSKSCNALLYGLKFLYFCNIYLTVSLNYDGVFTLFDHYDNTTTAVGILYI